MPTNWTETSECVNSCHTFIFISSSSVFFYILETKRSSIFAFLPCMLKLTWILHFFTFLSQANVSVLFLPFFFLFFFVCLTTVFGCKIFYVFLRPRSKSYWSCFTLLSFIIDMYARCWVFIAKQEKY